MMNSTNSHTTDFPVPAGPSMKTSIGMTGRSPWAHSWTISYSSPAAPLSSMAPFSS